MPTNTLALPGICKTNNGALWQLPVSLGGRKPKGEFKGKSSVFSTRITPTTRAALEREAQRSGRSLSQEVERRLEWSLGPPKQTDSYLRALLFLMEQVTKTFGPGWNANAWKRQAFRAAAIALLDRLIPASDEKIPEDVRPLSELDLPEGMAESAAVRGRFAAWAVWRLMEIAPADPIPKDMPIPKNSSLWGMPQVRQALGLTFDREDSDRTLGIARDDKGQPL